MKRNDTIDNDNSFNKYVYDNEIQRGGREEWRARENAKEDRGIER